MRRKATSLLALVVIGLLAAVPVFALPGQPDFSAHIYADGVAWGTKVTTVLPAPSGENDVSFDAFYVVTNGVAGQLPVSEAGPGNPDYNGGRWATKTVTWKAGSTPELLTSLADIEAHENDLMITSGPPDVPGAPPAYFSCPLLPVL
jgi:hypothetical protein